MFLNWLRNSIGPRSSGTARPRPSARPLLEALEDRLVPATPPLPIKLKPPIIVFSPNGTAQPPTSAFTPQQIRHAYGLDQISFAGITGDGAGQTIAIIDAGDNPGFVNSTDPAFSSSDLHQFDVTFGLNDPPSFIKINQRGSTTDLPPANVGGFAGEEALDIEWAHVAAPMANIILVEADTNFNTDLDAATAFAKTIPQVTAVSMSFGGGEQSSETGEDALFTTPDGHKGITFLASTGDDGAPGGYPAFSPNVVAVGGTSLVTDAQGNYQIETGWSGSGGGISQFEPQPAYQKGVVFQSTTQRTIPDVSIVADPNTGVAVLDSFDNGAATPWAQVGGTSLACPLWAGIIAVTDQARALVGQDSLDGATQTLPRIYQLPQSDFHDILTGNNGFPAGPGYDLVTGRGSPIAQMLIPDLAGVSFTNRLRAFHPFRYIVNANIPGAPTTAQNGPVFSGNLTAISFLTQPAASGQYAILIGKLPDGVTIDPSVPFITTSNGQIAIPLPVTGLPNQVAIRVFIALHNPKNVPLSTFFEGFAIALAPLPM